MRVPFQERQSWHVPGEGRSLPSCLDLQPLGFTGLSKEMASFLPFPAWASAHSPSLGDQFSNELDPRGGNKWPSQLWLAASSKCFSLAQREIFIRVFLGLF